MKRKRMWKRLLAGIVSLAVAVSSVPMAEVWAAEPENIAEYDYAKLYSLEDGRVGDYIAGNYRSRLRPFGFIRQFWMVP